jgi:hypothetical protein
MPTFRDVDPRTLHLPPGMWQGANPGKFARQLSKFGASTAGMPPLFVHADPDGRLMIMDGVTRATRVAKFLPGVLVRVEVIGVEPQSVAHHPTIADRLP